jgi:hypothetical protein
MFRAEEEDVTSWT